jgi:hypothetical protein
LVWGRGLSKEDVDFKTSFYEDYLHRGIMLSDFGVCPMGFSQNWSTPFHRWFFS